MRCAAARCGRDVRRAWVVAAAQRAGVPGGRLRAARSAACAAGSRGRRLAARRAGRGVRRDRQRGIRLGRIALDGRDRARPRARLRLHAAGAVPERADRARSFDTRSVGRRRARAAAVGAGRGAATGRRCRRDRAGGQHARRPSRCRHWRAAPGWSPARARTLVLPVPAGQVGAARARAREGLPGRAVRCAESAPGLAARGASVAASVAAFDGPGEYAAAGGARGRRGQRRPVRAAGDAALRRHAAGRARRLRRRRAGSAAATLPLAAEGAPPVSGMRGYRVRIGGRDAVVATGDPARRAARGRDAGRGPHASPARASRSTAVRTTAAARPHGARVTDGGVPGADGWSREPVASALRGARPGRRCRACDGLHWTIDDADEASADGDAADVAVAADGRHAVDATARSTAPATPPRARAAAIKVDRTPPETVAFEAPDPADPTPRVGSSWPTPRRASRAGGSSCAARARLAAGRDAARARIAGGRRALDDATLRAGAYELRALGHRRGRQRDDRHDAGSTGRRQRSRSRCAGATTLARASARAGRCAARLTAGGEPLGGPRASRSPQRLRGRARKSGAPVVRRSGRS